MKDCLNQNLDLGAFWENGFEAYFNSRTNSVGISK